MSQSPGYLFERERERERERGGQLDRGHQLEILDHAGLGVGGRVVGHGLDLGIIAAVMGRSCCITAVTLGNAAATPFAMLFRPLPVIDDCQLARLTADTFLAHLPEFTELVKLVSNFCCAAAADTPGAT